MPPQRKWRTSSFASARGDKSTGMSFSLKIAPSHGGIHHMALGPTQVLNPNGMSIGSAVFAGLTSVTHRQTTLLSL